MSVSHLSSGRVWAAALGVAALTAASTARAQSDNKVAAEALFQEAHKLLEAGHFPEACEKLAASERLEPAVGTLVNLAHCYEKIGRTATAWATYREAAAAARQAGQLDREKAARRAADALEPALPRLTIDVSPQPNDSKPEVKRDGVPILPDLWGTAVPVDPGDHTLSASAHGSRPWSAAIHAEARTSKSVSVPALDPIGPSPAPEPAPSAANLPIVTGPATPQSAQDAPTPGRGGQWNAQRTLAVIAAGVGLAGGAVALVEFVGYGNDKNQASSLCPGSCTAVDRHAQAVSLLDDARSAGNVAIVSGAVGGAALVAGVVLWLTAGSKAPVSPGGVLVTPLVTPQAAGLHVAGAW